MHTSEEKASQIKARQSAKESSASHEQEYTCKLAQEGLLESRPASLQRKAVPILNRAYTYKLAEEGLLASRLASLQRKAVTAMNREYTCNLAEDDLLESRPTSLQRTAANQEEENAKQQREAYWNQGLPACKGQQCQS